MFERLLTLLLSAKGSALAGLLVISTTGFVITGTIDGRDVDLTVKPIESAACVEAVFLRAQTLHRLEAAAADAREELQHLRERARERAEDEHKALDDEALRAGYEAALLAIDTALTDARDAVDAAAELGACTDGDADTTLSVDIARLRESYDGIVLELRTGTKGALDDAEAAFDLLVQNAPPLPESASDEDSVDTESGDSGESGDSDESGD